MYVGPELDPGSRSRLPKALDRVAVAVHRVTRPDLTIPVGGLLVIVRPGWAVEDMWELVRIMPHPWGWADLGDY